MTPKLVKESISNKIKMNQKYYVPTNIKCSQNNIPIYKTAELNAYGETKDYVVYIRDDNKIVVMNREGILKTITIDDFSETSKLAIATNVRTNIFVCQYFDNTYKAASFNIYAISEENSEFKISFLKKIGRGDGSSVSKNRLTPFGINDKYLFFISSYDESTSSKISCGLITFSNLNQNATYININKPSGISTSVIYSHLTMGDDSCLLSYSSTYGGYSYVFLCKIIFSSLSYIASSNLAFNTTIRSIFDYLSIGYDFEDKKYYIIRSTTSKGNTDIMRSDMFSIMKLGESQANYGNFYTMNASDSEKIEYTLNDDLLYFSKNKNFVGITKLVSSSENNLILFNVSTNKIEIKKILNSNFNTYGILKIYMHNSYKKYKNFYFFYGSETGYQYYEGSGSYSSIDNIKYIDRKTNILMCYDVEKDLIYLYGPSFLEPSVYFSKKDFNFIPFMSDLDFSPNLYFWIKDVITREYTSPKIKIITGGN